MKSNNRKNSPVINKVPNYVNEAETFQLLYAQEVDWQYVNTVKTYSEFNDQRLSEYLNLNVKTFREYKKPNSVLNANLKEHVVMLLAVFKHGESVFGSMRSFEQWLQSANFYFNGHAPEKYLNTITGIKFVDDRLTAMAYGDNV
ncbi:MAG: DUF2384 domain-containing protein [Chitinophagaceae bacterium]|nr:DUF2384 domain-containing protein [Chitinophagaceae bacterium]